MVTDEDLRRFWETAEGQRLQKQLLRFQPALKRQVDAVRRSETLGGFGWAFPLDMQPGEYLSIAEESTSYEKAEAAFLRYYTRNNGRTYKHLIDLLINEPGLQECKELLKEVKQSYNARRYRICVPALLPVLDHIAQKKWDAFLGVHGNAHKSINRKIGVMPDSFTDHFWRSVRAFVDRVFTPVRKSKPPTLNRHWILHGRGISDGSQVDCLRLLQAIRTLERLANIGEKVRK